MKQWWGDLDERVLQLDSTSADRHAMIAVDGTPVGYLRWQPIDRKDLDDVGLSSIPDDAVDADIFIGEAQWLGRGVGRQALRLLIDRLAATGDYSTLGLCTSVENHRAVRAFEGAGFERHLQYDDPIYGRCWVMIAALRDRPSAPQP